MAVNSAVGLFRERLDLVEFANQVRANERSRLATVKDFHPISGGFWQQAVNLNGTKPSTVFQWTVPQKSSLGFLLTWISMFGYTGAGGGTFFGSEAMDFAGSQHLQVNRNGLTVAPLQSFIALANQPVELVFGPADVISILIQQDPKFTGFVAPATINVVTGVRGYLVDQEILGRFQNQTFINAFTSIGNSGTSLATSGVAY